MRSGPPGCWPEPSAGPVGPVEPDDPVSLTGPLLPPRGHPAGATVPLSCRALALGWRIPVRCLDGSTRDALQQCPAPDEFSDGPDRQHLGREQPDEDEQLRGTGLERAPAAE